MQIPGRTKMSTAPVAPGGASASDFGRELLPDVRKMLTASNPERIAAIQRDRFIPTAQHLQALNGLRDLFEWIRGIRPIGYTLCGDTGAGKSLIIDLFAADHLFIPQPNSEADLNELIVIEPDSASDMQLVDLLLVATRSELKLRSLDDKKRHLYKVLKEQCTRSIIIDEANALLSGSVRQRRKIWNIVKKLINRGISIGLVCTDETRSAILRDSQIETRIVIELTLPLWVDGEEWVKFLFALEASFPLREASNIWADETMRKYLLDRAKGRLGSAVQLIQFAGIEAIKTGEERITLEILRAVKLRAGW
jgi:type II secretory pathway predicted ATPase ExeA